MKKQSWIILVLILLCSFFFQAQYKRKSPAERERQYLEDSVLIADSVAMIQAEEKAKWERAQANYSWSRENKQALYETFMAKLKANPKVELTEDELEDLAACCTEYLSQNMMISDFEEMADFQQQRKCKEVIKECEESLNK
jgi:GTPase Era involved in 16S rRNA processing